MLLQDLKLQNYLDQKNLVNQYLVLKRNISLLKECKEYAYVNNLSYSDKREIQKVLDLNIKHINSVNGLIKNHNQKKIDFR